MRPQPPRGYQFVYSTRSTTAPDASSLRHISLRLPPRRQSRAHADRNSSPDVTRKENRAKFVMRRARRRSTSRLRVCAIFWVEILHDANYASLRMTAFCSIGGMHKSRLTEKLRLVPLAMFSRATKRQRLLVEALALCVKDLDVPKERGLFLNLLALAHDHDLHICRIEIFPRGCH